MVKGDKSTLNEKQIVGLINSTPSKRYKSMMTIAADTSKIWCMGNDDGFMMKIIYLLSQQIEMCILLTVENSVMICKNVSMK